MTEFDSAGPDADAAPMSGIVPTDARDSPIRASDGDSPDDDGTNWSVIGTSASASACASANRSPGVFARHRRQSASISRGTSGRSCRGGTGASLTTLMSRSAKPSPTNGGLPVSRKYRIAPSAYTSAGGPTSLLSRACSGAM